MHITAGPGISRAFILGAGLGTRLRPLTHVLPKPLIPFFHEPLVLHSMRRCYDCGIREFIINTHHLAEAWDQAFPERSWNGCPVHFSHEPVLLDSGGGVKKIEPLASAEEPLLVINGDMAATFDLRRVMEDHVRHRPAVTLALRTSGDKRNVGFDFSSGQVTDMRHALGRDPGACSLPEPIAWSRRCSAASLPARSFPSSPCFWITSGRGACAACWRTTACGWTWARRRPISRPIWTFPPLLRASIPGRKCLPEPPWTLPA